jgi:hypothetical protein
VDRILYGEPRSYRASLSDVRVIIAVMCVLMVEMLCQVVMEQIPVLECLLPGTRGRMWSCLVLCDIKWHRYLRIPALGHLPDTCNP